MRNKLAAAPQTDSTAEREGVECTYTAADGATYRVTLARAGTGNPAFLKLSNDVMRPFSRSGQQHNDLPYEIQRRNTRKLYAGAVVKGWNEEDFGEAFTVDACIKVMETVNDFVDWVVEESQKAHLFHKARIEADSGN